MAINASTEDLANKLITHGMLPIDLWYLILQQTNQEKGGYFISNGISDKELEQLVKLELFLIEQDRKCIGN